MGLEAVMIVGELAQGSIDKSRVPLSYRFIPDVHHDYLHERDSSITPAGLE